MTDIKVDSELVTKDPTELILHKYPSQKPKEIHIFDTIAIFGQKGSGKTYFGKNALLENIDRVVVYDGEADYPTEGVFFKGEGKEEYRGWYIATDFRECFDFLRKMNKKKTIEKPFKLVYRPRDNTSPAEFDFFCKLVYAFGNCFIYVDELHNYLPSYLVKIPYNVAQVLRLGRHRNIGFIGISQRPADVSPKFKGLASKAFIFKLIFHADVKYVVDWFGKALLKVKQLKDFRFIYFDGEKLYYCEKIGDEPEQEILVDEEPAGAAGQKKTEISTPEEQQDVIEIVEEREEHYE